MRISPAHVRRTRHGYALLVVMSIMAVMLLVFASTMYWTSSNANVTQRNNLFTSSEAAAESCTENILATMMRDYTYGSLNPVASYTSNSMAYLTNRWPLYFQFSDTNGNTANIASVSIGQVSTAATNLNSQFVGLFGFVQPVTVASTATPEGVGYNLSATVYQSIQFAQIPLFQYAVFYNMDLEINPSAAMTINGRVHSNGNIWATGNSSSVPLTFSSSVDAAGTISNLPSPLDPHNVGRNGNVVYSLSGQPVPDYASLSLPIGGSTNNNPTNVQAILEAPPLAFAQPNNSSAYSSNGLIYLANAADLIISNSSSGLSTALGTNLAVYYQNPNDTLNPLQYVPPDLKITNTSTGVVYSNYSFATNVSFYDYRESDTIQAVQIDVGLLDTWLTNTATRGGSTYNVANSTGGYSKGHTINSIYVYNKIPITSSQLPAVRMVNGQRLPPAGLTVATTDPVYIKGDYNTTVNGTAFSTALGDTVNTAPAAILADAVTILSSSWSDNNGAGTPLALRIPVNTTINAAMLEGIVPSNGSYYSGGLENFLRLLENWGGTVTYNGSIVVMYPSQYATNYWIAPGASGAYYGAPTRNWGFDTNFSNAALLPPLTPTIKATIRGNYAAW